MNRIFLDFGDKICILYSSDRYIVSYEEFDYPANGSVLDLVYSKLDGVEIDEAFVVFNGVVSSKSDGAVTLESGSIYESVKDFRAVKHLLLSLHISKISFFDAAGYYLFDNTHRTIFVDSANGIFNIIVCDGQKIETSEVATESSVKNQLNVLKNRREVHKIVFVPKLVKENLVSYFCNIGLVEDYKDKVSMLHYLGVFAFTMTVASNRYIIDGDSLKEKHFVLQDKPSKAEFSENAVRTPVGASAEPETKGKGLPDTVGKDLHHLTDLTVGRKHMKAKKPKEKKEKQPKPSESKKKKHRIPSFFSILVIVLSGVMALGSITGKHLVGKLLEKKQESYNSVNNAYLTSYAQLEAYKRIDSSKQTPGIDSISVLNTLDTTKFSSSTKIVVLESGIVITDTRKTKQEAETFCANMVAGGKGAQTSVRKSGNVWEAKVDFKS